MFFKITKLTKKPPYLYEVGRFKWVEELESVAGVLMKKRKETKSLPNLDYTTECVEEIEHTPPQDKLQPTSSHHL